MADARRMVALGMPTQLSVEVADQIDAAGGGAAVTWGNLPGKPATFPPTIGTTATTAKAGDWVPPFATETTGGYMTGGDKAKLNGIATGATATPLATTAPAALGTAAVGVGTTAARSDHVHAIPGASNGTARGTVLRAAAQADSVATDAAALVVDFNALLAKLRTAGVIAT